MRAGRRAVYVAATYFVVACAYIVVSSHVAASMAANVADMERVERVKGIVFVFVTAAAVYAAAYVALARAQRDARELERHQQRIVESERLATAGLMAAGIAHDANNLLTALQCELETLTPDAPPDPAALEIALTSVGRIADLNRRLASAGRQRTSIDLRELDLTRTVRELVESFKSHRDVRGCTLSVVGADREITLRTSPTLLAQAVGNLVVNAAEATHGNGRVEVRLFADTHRACIEVHDDGPGVPAARRANLFNALETTKSSGTGLGLYSTRVCVQAVGGDIDVGDSPLGGAMFRICLDRDPAIGSAR